MSRFNGVLTLMILVILSTGSSPTQAHRRFFKHRPTFWSIPNRFRPQRAFHGGRVNRPVFEGNGCDPGTVALVNSSDTTSYSLSVLFSTFTAQTSGTKTRDKKHCVITVALEPAENMQIGVARVDFRGDAYVPGERSWARLQAFYRLGYYGRAVLLNKRYDAGYDDVIYESGEVTPISWTPCARFGPIQRKHEFRIHTMITAAKKTVQAGEVSIAIDSIDANVQKGVYYQLITRACPGTAQSVPTMSPAPVTQVPDTLAPDTPAPFTPTPVTDTPAPDTPSPDTPSPDTPAPDTLAPDTPSPVTPAPDTPVPDSITPITTAPDTPSPDTPALVTQARDTPSPDTPTPVNPPVTPAPDTPSPVTPASDTPAPDTPAPVTPDTPVPDSVASVTSAPDTIAPSSSPTQVSDNPPVITEESGTLAPSVGPSPSTQEMDTPST